MIAWLMLVLSLAAAEPPSLTDLRALDSSSAIANSDTTVTRTIEPLPSLMAPPQPRGLTRVETTWRPFLGFVGNSWGAIGEARIEHYFKRPFMLGVELSPVAIASAGDGLGAISHVRVIGALVTKHLSLGLGVGSRMERFGNRGVSIAPSGRLGSIDGLNLQVTYTHVLSRNHYTDKPTIGFSNLLAKLQVPVSRGLALQLDSGLSLDTWGFLTLGLRDRIFGNGGPNTLYVSGGLGLAMVIDKSPCTYTAAVPCGPSAISYGPTMSFGLEYRF